MSHGFASHAQKQLFQSVLRHLGKIGYRNSLLVEHYDFADHFSDSNHLVRASAAAFGQLPPDPNTACFGVAVATPDLSGAKLIDRYRALGAPIAFEVRNDCVARWRVTPRVSNADCQDVSSLGTLPKLFDEHRDKWNPQSLLRAKNIASTGPRQLDFIDTGLMPALESHVHEKLDPLLREILRVAKTDYLDRHGADPDSDQLFRLVFRALTGKVMHDRGLEPFSGINGLDEPGEFLDKVALHYNDPKPILDDAHTQKLVVSQFWKGMGFAHLSIDVLAFVWENTLVSDDIREAKGIHATPPNVARFVVRALMDDPPSVGRFVVEPCCGGGTFLIAALQRSRELLPADPDLRGRHLYFSNILRGFDTESFGIEVAQSCLTLADFPNPNGWYLKDEDVFGSSTASPRFTASLQDARFILCNPPFEDFSEDERARYGATFVARPVELLYRVLALAPQDAEIGFVLPHQIIDGHAYSSLRRRLGERFTSMRVVQLPEGVFQKARFPSALLIARDPKPHASTHISFAYVSDPRAFIHGGLVDRTETAQKSADELGESISIPELKEIWSFLSRHSTLASAVVDIARGVEWDSDTQGHVLEHPQSGTLPGFHTSKNLRCFEPPQLSFLVPEDKKYEAWDRPWHLPKVVCNAVRKRQRGPWKLAACPVDLNLVCTQNFTVLWPRQPWTAKSLAAVMNGPVACAFMACHETWKHITKENLCEVPIPALCDGEIDVLNILVDQYQTVAALKRDGILESTVAGREMTRLLKDIDAIVLQGYNLSDLLTKDLLSFFGTYSRPASVQYDIAELIGHELTTGSPEREIVAIWTAFETSLREDRV